jgi:hypothetical protein
MPPRPKDADEFDAAMARIALELDVAGAGSMAALISQARADMRAAGYGASPGAEQTRLRLHGLLQQLASRPELQSVKDDLVVATRWIPKAGEVAREVSAKRHLDRRSARDLARH